VTIMLNLSETFFVCRPTIPDVTNIIGTVAKAANLI
jgi:hypothetical protein